MSESVDLRIKLSYLRFNKAAPTATTANAADENTARPIAPCKNDTKLRKSVRYLFFHVCAHMQTAIWNAHVCMYVCMYVACENVFNGVSDKSQRGTCTEFVCMYVCMYIYVYIYIYTLWCLTCLPTYSPNVCICMYIQTDVNNKRLIL